MKLRLSRIFSSLRRGVTRLRSRRRLRDLRRDLREQSTEEYWRRRERAQARRHRLVVERYQLGVVVDHIRSLRTVILRSIPSLLQGFVFGGAAFSVVLTVEAFLDARTVFTLIPTGEPMPPLGAFPSLAVQVSASLLGFYLASVSIVLGTSYHDVSADVRGLLWKSTRMRFHLGTIGVAIGAGLTLVVLQSFEFSFGYMTIVVYGMLVAFSGYTFFQLAFQAFNLFNPIVLSYELLDDLYRAINRMDTKGLRGDERILRATAQNANRSLQILGELVHLASKRSSVETGALTSIVEHLLAQVRIYAQRKHLLAPTSGWFIPEPAYPKWIEADHSQVSIALQASTPLQPRLEPRVDWLERRSAELASTALEACIVADDRVATLRITASVSQTVHILAKCSRIEDARVVAQIVRDRCWNVNEESEAGIAAVAEPPLFLTSLLLGWRQAIISWPDEIRSTISATKWDSRRTKSVQIRGTERVWFAAQRLLGEVQAEQDIEGKRVTPDWYLRLALADSCIRALREFADQLPDLLEEFTTPTLSQYSAVLEATVGDQALQSLAKADFIAGEIPQTAAALKCLLAGNDPQPAQEFESLTESIVNSRSAVLERIAVAVKGLRPERSQSTPDIFGGAWFTLIHHTEDAIATGNMELVSRVFSSLLVSTLTLQNYVTSTYRPPTYQGNAPAFDPVIDLLELSGLAMIYAVIRGDQSDTPIRRLWTEYLAASKQPVVDAKWFLDVLDLTDGRPSPGISPRDISRTDWEIRLSNKIIESGLARPILLIPGQQQEWNAPPLIKLLGVSADRPSIYVSPRTIFTAQVIGPLSGEAEEILRTRAGLSRYFQRADRIDLTNQPDEGIPIDGE